MRTRFSPIYETTAPPDPRVEGVHLKLGGLSITGMRPSDEEWGQIWFQNLDGWWNRPGSTGDSTQRTLAHGSWRNRAFFQSRVVEITGLLVAPSGLRGAAARRALRTGIDVFNSIIPLDDPQPLVVYEDGLVRNCLVRQSGEVDLKWARGPDLAVEWNIQLVSDDYRKFAGETPADGWQNLGPVALPQQYGGMVFPMVFPMRFTGGSTNDSLVLPTSGGNAPADLIIQFTGPATQPGYRVNEGDAEQWFDVDLSEYDVLEVNFQTHAVNLNGKPRRGAVRGAWGEPRPGDMIHFTAGEETTGARMYIQYKEAWL